MNIKEWLEYFYTYLHLWYYSFKYRQSVSKVLSVYINLYCNLKLTKIFLKRVKDEKLDFDTSFEDLREAQMMIEEFVRKDGDLI